ncbi:16393_t:CDS:2, partial [Racocetra persica]
RRIWSCRPLLTEEDYSENSYVIHATSKSSQSRKNQMSSMNLGKKPDLQVLLKLDIEANELVLVEISCLFPEPNKEIFRLEEAEDTSSEARLIYCELEKIPVLGIQITIPLQISTHQVFEEFLRSSLKLRAIVEEIVRMS